MATLILDIDGTIVEHHTNKWLPGAKEMLIKASDDGHKILFITMRGVQDDGKEWSIARTRETILKDLDNWAVNYMIHFGMPSPRIIHDDMPIAAIQRVRNAHWVGNPIPQEMLPR